MKFVKLTTGNVAEATVVPISEWIDKANNRSFAGEGYIQITESIEDTEVLTGLYNSSAEADGIKTVSSFTLPTTDSNGKKRWYDKDTGVLKQYTYNDEGVITGSENA
tara:strand:+ start:23044 stop:23364 length:321 start_codon:yes stop_codon:yes gene_type:complete